ncbi:MAG: matrixin family metalloprotease, partial [Aggregatilineales bacterium]
DRTDLSFQILNCPATINCNDAHVAIRRAFDAWATISALTFQEVTGGADIELRWSATEEDLGQRGGALAFAYFPSFGGDVYFDDAERWSLYDGGSTDLFAVAVHEIGHSLGMDHTDDPNAIMFPYSGAAANLQGDDIAGIQRLYGAGDGTQPDIVEADLPDNLPDDGRIEVAEGSIDNSSYYEIWNFDASAGETIELTMETMQGNLDAYLAVLTPDYQTVLAEDDDGLGNRNARIVYTFPQAGEYTIIATRYDQSDGESTGNYRLTLTREDIPVPTPEPATPENFSLRVSNISGVTLCAVYISPSDNDEWGTNYLEANETLDNGIFIQWAATPDSYDVRVEDCNENYLEEYFIDLTQRSVDIEVYKSEMVITRLDQ